MAHGLFHGDRHGLVHGARHNSLALSGISVSGVTRDAISGKYAPATGAEWTTFLAAVGISASVQCVWTCQDASGPVIDTADSANLLDTPTAPTYQNSVTGWARKAINFVDNTANQRLFNNSTAPDTSAVSTNVLAYIQFPSVAPGGTRGVISKTTSNTHLDLDTTGKLRLVDGGSALLTNSVLGAVRPIWFKTNLTASQSIVYTDQEEFIGTFVAPTAGPFVGFGGANPGVIVPPTMSILYAAEFQGASAELTKAQLRTITNGLGWSVAW